MSDDAMHVRFETGRRRWRYLALPCGCVEAEGLKGVESVTCAYHAQDKDR